MRSLNECLWHLPLCGHSFNIGIAPVTHFQHAIHSTLASVGRNAYPVKLIALTYPAPITLRCCILSEPLRTIQH